MTVLANVNSATFAPFARVCGGAIGSRLLQPDHTIVLVNSDLGASRDIGNLWVSSRRASICFRSVGTPSSHFTGPL
jgi:hypothetical protein